MRHQPTRRNALDTARHLAQWAARRRRTAAVHLLRGICYGIGTSAVTLLAVWAEQHL
ncbi:hypothetical protein GCM10010232_68230 [Streptomyces amakusaensis]|uniref:Uncharacterized protein n=1 Tax=Streptomyces amakusaensis TaxID=67271 RepID=A0ABW0AR91_9ACTN